MQTTQHLANLSSSEIQRMNGQAKRAKGIEANLVIIATLNEEIRKNEMYVGASRARSKLVIVGPESFANRLKIAS